jgi:hypothetical protein
VARINKYRLDAAVSGMPKSPTDTLDIEIPKWTKIRNGLDPRTPLFAKVSLLGIDKSENNEAKC